MRTIIEEERKKYINPEDIIKKLNLAENMIIADIGCGTGYFSLPASEHIGEDGRIYSLDVEEKAIHILKTRITKINIVPIVTQRYHFPLKSKFIELVFTSFNISEAEEKDKLILELRRIMKDDGRLCIVEAESETSAKKLNVDSFVSQSEMEQILVNNKFTVTFNEKINNIGYLLIAQKSE